MAGRIRSIKPEILEDEKTAALSHLAWRLFVSLWLIADDYGNLRGDPVYVLGQTLWATAETRETIANALDELVGVGLLVRYAVRAQSYCHIAGWAKHQKVAHPGKPRMPGPDEADREPSREVETLAESSGGSRETLMPDLRPPTSDLRPPTEILSPARDPAVPQPEPASVPAVSPPAPAHEDIAGTQVADFRTSPGKPATPIGDRDVKSANPIPAPPFEPSDPRAIGRLAEAFYQRVSAARIAMAAELKLPEPLPFPPITPATRTRGFVELSTRIREEGELAPAVCERVLENAVKLAREKRSIDWLGDRLFGDKAWSNARDGVDPSARVASAARAGPPPREPEQPRKIPTLA